MAEEDKEIYRPEAIKHSSSPEQLEQLMHITQIPGWIALFGILIFIITIFFWSVFGRLDTTVSAPCILFPSTGGPLTIDATETAYVTKFLVPPGALVNAGEPLLTLKYLDQSEPSGTTIVTQFNGQLLDYLVNPGELVTPGKPIVILQPLPASISLVAQTFIAPQEGKLIKTGMPVHVALDQANPSIYGYIQGQVLSISNYPSTAAGLMRVLQNQNLANMMSQNGAPYEAIINLSVDPKTPNAYEWTSQTKYPNPVTTGSLCTANVIIHSQAPITLLLPLFKHLTGG